MTLGTTGSNSSVNARVDAGSLTVGGVITVGLNNGARWSILGIGGGTFTSSEAVTGVQLGGAFAGNAIFIVRGTGVATVERIQLGQGSVGGSHVVRTADTGTLYVGSGGIVLGDVTSTGILRLAGGTLGAKADWSTALGAELSGPVTVRAADAASVAHNIAIGSGISGAGSLTKTGAGTLTLGGVNTFVGDPRSPPAPSV